MMPPQRHALSKRAEFLRKIRRRLYSNLDGISNTDGPCISSYNPNDISSIPLTGIDVGQCQQIDGLWFLRMDQMPSELEANHTGLRDTIDSHLRSDAKFTIDRKRNVYSVRLRYVGKTVSTLHPSIVITTNTSACRAKLVDYIKSTKPTFMKRLQQYSLNMHVVHDDTLSAWCAEVNYEDMALYLPSEVITEVVSGPNGIGRIMYKDMRGGTIGSSVAGGTLKLEANQAVSFSMCGSAHSYAAIIDPDSLWRIAAKKEPAPSSGHSEPFSISYNEDWSADGLNLHITDSTWDSVGITSHINDGVDHLPTEIDTLHSHCSMETGVLSAISPPSSITDAGSPGFYSIPASLSADENNQKEYFAFSTDVDADTHVDISVPSTKSTLPVSINAFSERADWSLLKPSVHDAEAGCVAVFSVNQINGYTISEVRDPHDLSTVKAVVALPEGELECVLLPNTVLLRVGAHKYDLRVITTAQPLEQGSSGAWVTYRNQLIGSIVAVNASSCEAYILPAHTILLDIEETTGSRVSLPLLKDMGTEVPLCEQSDTTALAPDTSGLGKQFEPNMILEREPYPSAHGCSRCRHLPRVAPNTLEVDDLDSMCLCMAPMPLHGYVQQLSNLIEDPMIPHISNDSLVMTMNTIHRPLIVVMKKRGAMDGDKEITRRRLKFKNRVRNLSHDLHIKILFVSRFTRLPMTSSPFKYADIPLLSSSHQVKVSEQNGLFRVSSLRYNSLRFTFWTSTLHPASSLEFPVLERYLAHLAKPAGLLLEFFLILDGLDESNIVSQDFSCQFIKGICDYADIRKNDTWRKQTVAASGNMAADVFSVVSLVRVLLAAEVRKNRHHNLDIGITAVPEARSIRGLSAFHLSSVLRENFHCWTDSTTAGQHFDIKPDSVLTVKSAGKIIDPRKMTDLDFNARSLAAKVEEGTSPLTSQWLMSNPGDVQSMTPLQNWILESQAQPVLWITGKPGAGKSTMLKFIHENLGVGHYSTFHTAGEGLLNMHADLGCVTALAYALAGGQYQINEELLSHGADPSSSRISWFRRSWTLQETLWSDTTDVLGFKLENLPLWQLKNKVDGPGGQQFQKHLLSVHDKVDSTESNHIIRFNIIVKMLVLMLLGLRDGMTSSVGPRRKDHSTQRSDSECRSITDSKRWLKITNCQSAHTLRKDATNCELKERAQEGL